jgi:hypothetical protein
MKNLYLSKLSKIVAISILIVLSTACGGTSEEGPPPASMLSVVTPTPTPMQGYVGSEAEGLKVGFALRRSTGVYLDSIRISASQTVSTNEVPPELSAAYILYDDSTSAMHQIIIRIEMIAAQLGREGRPMLLQVIAEHAAADGTRVPRSIRVSDEQLHIIAQRAPEGSMRDSIIGVYDYAGDSQLMVRDGDIQHSAWAQRPISPSDQQEVDRIIARITTAIHALDAASPTVLWYRNEGGGDVSRTHYYLNDAHAAVLNPRNHRYEATVGIRLHDIAHDGDAMSAILQSMEQHDEEVFVTNMIALATGYLPTSILAKDAFIRTFSQLYVTGNFPSLGLLLSYIHYLMQCGMMY